VRVSIPQIFEATVKVVDVGPNHASFEAPDPFTMKGLDRSQLRACSIAAQVQLLDDAFGSCPDPLTFHYESDAAHIRFPMSQMSSAPSSLGVTPLTPAMPCNSEQASSIHVERIPLPLLQAPQAPQAPQSIFEPQSIWEEEDFTAFLTLPPL
jgi:hypothetical protein